MVDRVANECKIIDVAVPWGSRMRAKERERIENCGNPNREESTLWNMKKVNVIPFVIWCTEEDLNTWIKKITINVRTGYMHERESTRKNNIIKKSEITQEGSRDPKKI